MTTWRERLLILIGVEGQSAEKSIKSFSERMGEAQGISGKLKVGLGAVTDLLSSPAGLTTAATAGATAAFKMAQQFSDLGVEVGKFSDATGLSAEESSKWVEVAHDLNIETDSLQTVIGKLNKNLDPKTFAEYGIAIAHTKDGTVDANQTFINAVGALHNMRDASERAKAGAALFGRGWQQVAEIVGMSAKDLEGRLNGVEKAKIFDSDKVKLAREFRDTMDELRDKLEAVALQLGEKVIPIADDLARSLGDITNVAGPTIDAFAKFNEVVPSALSVASDGVSWFKRKWHEATDDVKKQSVATTAATSQLRDYMDFLSASAGKASDATTEMARSLKAEHDRTRDLINATKDLDDLQKDRIGTLEDAMKAENDVAKALADEKAALQDSKATLADRKDAILRSLDAQVSYANAVAKLAGHELDAKDQANIQRAALEDVAKTVSPNSDLSKWLQNYINLLNAIPARKTTAISAPFSGASAPDGRGPGPDGARVVNNITINTKADPNDVVAIIKRYTRQNGRGWM